jgi:hypothetical protein
MLRRDYILRMIEEFVRSLARLNSLKRGENWDEASGVLDGEFHKLLEADASTIARMSETELLARIVKGAPTQAVPERSLMVATLLKEAGDVATAQDRIEDGRLAYLKGLDLLLNALGAEEAFECPEFVPTVELFVTLLREGPPLPLATQARLMQHYERVGEFGKAEDALFAMLDEDGNNSGLVEFGLAFYRRIANQSDTALTDGNLPRTELDAGLKELESRQTTLQSRP